MFLVEDVLFVVGIATKASTLEEGRARSQNLEEFCVSLTRHLPRATFPRRPSLDPLSSLGLAALDPALLADGGSARVAA
jgi:hypothetical protein